MRIWTYFVLIIYFLLLPYCLHGRKISNGGATIRSLDASASVLSAQSAVAVGFTGTVLEAATTGTAGSGSFYLLKVGVVRVRGCCRSYCCV